MLKKKNKANVGLYQSVFFCFAAEIYSEAASVNKNDQVRAGGHGWTPPTRWEL